MRYLFLLISFLYGIIFYIFYTFSIKKDIYFKATQTQNIEIKNLSLFENMIFSDENTFVIQSFFGNLIYELSFFVVIGIVLFFYFGGISLKKSQDKKEEHSKDENFIDIHNEHKTDKKQEAISIFKGMGYYFGFILFYISIYLISKSFDFISFSLFILIINIVVYIYYFLSKFSSLSKDFLKTNLFLFSFYYLVNYFSIIVTGNNFFTYIDIINSFLLILIFPSIIYFEKINSEKKQLDYIIVSHFSIYIFGVFLFYSYFYIFSKNLIFWLCILFTIFGIIWFEFLPKIKYLKNDKYTFRYIGIIFGYLGIIFGYISLFYQMDYIILFILLLQSYYNFFIHKKYINIISFSLAIFSVLFLTYYIILKFELLNYKETYFSLFSVTLSFVLILVTYLFKFKTIYDIYIIHFFSYIINIITIIIYVFFIVINNFDILNIGILLFLESIYFFLSYNKLKLSSSNKEEEKH